MLGICGATNRDIGPLVDADKDMRRSRMMDLIPSKDADDANGGERKG